MTSRLPGPRWAGVGWASPHSIESAGLWQGPKQAVLPRSAHWAIWGLGKVFSGGAGGTAVGQGACGVGE